jgi:hypothetical protein
LQGFQRGSGVASDVPGLALREHFQVLRHDDRNDGPFQEAAASLRFNPYKAYSLTANQHEESRTLTNQRAWASTTPQPSPSSHHAEPSPKYFVANLQ